ncbi:DMT family transporter [Microvirga arsenatis]|uniref:EamA family transporter n=1 Tax=Microvirga arsenatis TaxID=2692265 RepID=A0ABW9YZH9_9HYPH|nr:DMT family transporter [Microvirga arsenatis]NBJ12171.1 EamA family transporter [Microvirga arsenatis]NBJ25823.1 EamA family transporter [Microvirga arsenatis]
MSPTSTTARLEPGFASAFAALCLGAVAMGISPIFVRFASADMGGAPADVGPFASAFWRVALCLPLLYAWMRIEERRAPAGTPRVQFSKASILGGIVFAGDLFFWHLAILRTTVANATFFATLAPLFVVLTVWLVLRQRVSRGTFLGLALCLLGGAALIGQSLQADPARIAGDLYGIATAFFFGMYFLAASRARKTAGAARVTFEAGLITSAILLVVAVLFDTRVIPQTGRGIAALLAMSYVSHAGGQGLLAIALGRLPPVFSSLVIFLEAIAAAVFGWAVLGEELTPVQALGGALILFGIWAARPKPDPEPSSNGERS